MFIVIRGGRSFNYGNFAFVVSVILFFFVFSFRGFDVLVEFCIFVFGLLVRGLFDFFFRFLVGYFGRGR